MRSCEFHRFSNLANRTSTYPQRDRKAVGKAAAAIGTVHVRQLNRTEPWVAVHVSHAILLWSRLDGAWFLSYQSIGIRTHSRVWSQARLH